MSVSPVRVAILDDYQNIALTIIDWSSIIDRMTVDVYSDTLTDENRLADRLQSYQVICAMRERTKFTPTLLDRLPNLKMITTTGMRNAGIDMGYAQRKGVVVSGTGSGGNSTIEHIWALILAAARHISSDDARIKAKSPVWQTSIPFGLSGKTLGLIGVGRLGSQTAQVAKAFNMRVIGWSPNLTPERAKDADVEFVHSKAALLQESDFISIHLVLSDSTRHIISDADFAVMKPTAVLINTSRGPIVDEVGLINALQNKKIAGAGLDVFDVEPLPLHHPLRDLKNVTLTPHVGYVSDSNYEVFWGDTVENIAGFLDGKPVRVLNP